MAVLSDKAIIEYLNRAGFSGTSLPIMGAIVLAESGGNPKALNDNPRTGDLSYGLAQINMIGALGPARRRWFDIDDNDELFKPATNCRCAFLIFKAAGRRFTDWTTYKHSSHLKFIDRMEDATRAVLGRFVLRRYLMLREDMQTGTDVKAWQKVCGAYPDGEFGPKTYSRTKAWQSHHKDVDGHALAVDGIVGPLTAGAAGWKWEGPK
jgi:peptidoglycan hydrolase-like protein with peptidoglycan-binding domain